MNISLLSLLALSTMVVPTDIAQASFQNTSTDEIQIQKTRKLSLNERLLMETFNQKYSECQLAEDPIQEASWLTFQELSGTPGFETKKQWKRLLDNLEILLRDVRDQYAENRSTTSSSGALDSEVLSHLFGEADAKVFILFFETLNSDSNKRTRPFLKFFGYFDGFSQTLENLDQNVLDCLTAYIDHCRQIEKVPSDRFEEVCKTASERTIKQLSKKPGLYSSEEWEKIRQFIKEWGSDMFSYYYGRGGIIDFGSPKAQEKLRRICQPNALNITMQIAKYLWNPQKRECFMARTFFNTLSEAMKLPRNDK